MDIQNLKSRADRSLQNVGYDPKKLAVLHAGVALVFSLALTLLQLSLNHGIDSAPGLSGIGTRTILSTVQMMLSFASIVLLPFWEIGFFRATLHIAQDKTATPSTLLEGFRRMAPVLRLFLLQLVLYFGLLLISSNAASVIYLLTPFSDNLIQVMEPLIADPALTEQSLLESSITVEQLLPNLIPLYVILGIIFAVLAIPLFYRFRMSQFVIMDDPQVGALAAMKSSARMMFGHCRSLFRLDLHFWWFYLAQAVITLVAWLDVLLPALGITLPFSADMLLIIFYVLHMGLSLLLAWQCNSRVQTTYAQFYLWRKATQAPAVPQE